MRRRARSRTLGRRSFLKEGAGLVAAPWLLQLSACSSASHDTRSGSAQAAHPDTEDERAPEAAKAEVDAAASGTLPAGAVLLGLYSGDPAEAMDEALQHLDFGFLKRGDSVLIKVASNSGNPHPATTSPVGVRAMVEHLKALGAGRVIVADQAGVEHVRRSQKGRFSSTRERFQTNGLAALEDVAELHFFDEGDWDAGYFSASLPDANHWPRGMYVANIVRDVDHILYMPRISAHTLAGITTAHKSAIGWLRDDSRHDLHNDAQSFYEKYAEINYCKEIAERFRMVVTLNEKVQLFGGPDDGTAFVMDPPLILASTSLASHDSVATSILVSLQNGGGASPSGMTYSAPLAPTLNALFAGGTGVGMGDAGAWISGSPRSMFSSHDFVSQVSGERAAARGWELSGGRPDNVRVIRGGEPMDAKLQANIEAHGKGFYRFG